MATTAEQLGTMILNATGLPVDRCVSLTLKCETGKLAVLTVSYAVDYDTVGKIIEHIRSFDLIEKTA